MLRLESDYLTLMGFRNGQKNGRIKIEEKDNIKSAGLSIMKARLLLILVGAVLFLQSCATPPTTKMTSVASSDQKTGYDGTITSQKKHFVSLSPYSVLEFAKDKAMFILVVENDGEGPISISNEDISMIFEGNGEDLTSKRISVQSLDDFIVDIGNEYNDNEKKFIYSTLYDIWYLSTNGIIDSETATDRAQDLKYDIEAMRRQNEVFREMLPGVFIKSQTIMPDSSYTGIVAFDAGDNKDADGKMQIIVSLDGEQHSFAFNRNFNDTLK
jgi:archaellum component FlaG (FlaF/FlaG flagellin family)